MARPPFSTDYKRKASAADLAVAQNRTYKITLSSWKKNGRLREFWPRCTAASPNRRLLVQVVRNDNFRVGDNPSRIRESLRAAFPERRLWTSRSHVPVPRASNRQAAAGTCW